MSKSQFNTTGPFPDIFPKSWHKKVGSRDFLEFRNLQHFKYHVSKLTQKNDDMCDVTYKKALADLLGGVSGFPINEQVSIRNLVRSNLFRRGLITQEVYEHYHYTVDGTSVAVDIGKFTNGEPDCILSPTKQYVDFFYELYISISYSARTSNRTIQQNIAKLLATIEELERQHIFIKITLILPINGITKKADKNFFSSIPLFSHKEFKNVDTMSSVLNDRLLRKFYFAVLEDFYGDNLNDHNGTVMELDSCMNVGRTFNEIEFFETVLKTVGA